MKTIILAAVVLAVSSNAMATRIVPGGLNASLDTGSLAGTHFPVSFSYDADQVSLIGNSFVGLNSFNFTILNVLFTQNDIFQGGQAIFRNGVLNNVIASFQVHLPPQSPVENITFGFGGPGIIGYTNLNGQFGLGSFTFVSTGVPELISAYSLGLGLITLFGLRVRRRK
jgi:hypothetical protein